MKMKKKGCIEHYVEPFTQNPTTNAEVDEKIQTKKIVVLGSNIKFNEKKLRHFFFFFFYQRPIF